jgi:hypothetical protein
MRNATKPNDAWWRSVKSGQRNPPVEICLHRSCLGSTCAERFSGFGVGADRTPEPQSASVLHRAGGNRGGPLLFGLDIRGQMALIRRARGINLRCKFRGLLDQDGRKLRVCSGLGEPEKRRRLTREIVPADHDTSPTLLPDYPAWT